MLTLTELTPIIEQNVRTGALGLADHIQCGLGHAMLIFLPVGLAVPVDGHEQAFGKRIHHGDAHTVQATGDFVGVVVEFPAGVKHRHDDLGGRQALFFVKIHRDSTAVVDNADGLVFVDGDIDFTAVPGQGFVYGVVDGLEHHVV